MAEARSKWNDVTIVFLGSDGGSIKMFLSNVWLKYNRILLEVFMKQPLTRKSDSNTDKCDTVIKTV